MIISTISCSSWNPYVFLALFKLTSHISSNSVDERWVGKHETFSEYDEERLFISHYLHWLSVLQLGNWVFLLSVRYEIVPPKNDFKPYSGQVTMSRVSIS